MDTASLPDFSSVEAEERREELKRFHDFVEGLTPEDFALDRGDVRTAADGTLSRPSQASSHERTSGPDERASELGHPREKPGQDLRDDLADGTNTAEHPGS